jgi:hypothetical protein
MSKIFKQKNILIFSILYVGFGTFSVLSIYPKDMFYGQWANIGLMITFPVTVISFGIRFAESGLLVYVYITQFIMLLLTYFITSFLNILFSKN